MVLAFQDTLLYKFHALYLAGTWLTCLIAGRTLLTDAEPLFIRRWESPKKVNYWT